MIRPDNGRLAFALFSLLGPATPDDAPPFARADTVANKRFGTPPVRVGSDVDEPRKIHDAQPVYPTRKPTPRGQGIWIAEILIDPAGVVQQVWVLRDLQFDPPWPEYSAALTDAVMQWRYAPTIVGGRAVPVGMIVTLSPKWL